MQVPLLSPRHVEGYRTGERTWLPEQHKTLMVPENALTIENVSILQLRASTAGDEGTKAGRAAVTARTSIRVGHTVADPECSGHTVGQED